MKLEKKILYSGIIELKTGLHIGDSKSNLNIGGVDNAVIKTPDGKPYIPGSSLKGKMRSLLEIAEGTIGNNGGPTTNANTNSGKLFGTAAGDGDCQPSRLIIRDCMCEDDNFEIEIKTEVNIDRIKGKSLSGPRKMERVAAGTKFKYEMILNIFDIDDESKLKASLAKAMKLIEDDYLGGSGSRGSGQICFINKEERIIYPQS